MVEYRRSFQGIKMIFFFCWESYFEICNSWMQRSKEGLLPFVELNGEQIADSQLIIARLQKHFNVDVSSSYYSLAKQIFFLVLPFSFKNRRCLMEFGIHNRIVVCMDRAIKCLHWFISFWISLGLSGPLFTRSARFLDEVSMFMVNAHISHVLSFRS